MINIRGRALVIPIPERQIGTNFDNNAEVRYFCVDRYATGGIDLSHLNYHIDLKYAGSRYDTWMLDKEVSEDKIKFIWLIQAAHVQHPGTVWASIRGTDDEGTCKWASNAGAFYVNAPVDTPGNFDKLSELEQMERLINAALEKCENVILESSEKVDIAIEQMNAEIDRCTEMADQSISDANLAVGKANETLYMIDILLETADASVTDAAGSAQLSQSWAVGGTGVRVGEDTNNSEYHSRQAETAAQDAKNEADRASMYANFVTPDFILANNRIYINRDSTVAFGVWNNRLYLKLPT